MENNNISMETVKKKCYRIRERNYVFRRLLKIIYYKNSRRNNFGNLLASSMYAKR